MAEHFEDKDYGEYFLKLQQELEQKPGVVSERKSPDAGQDTRLSGHRMSRKHRRTRRRKKQLLRGIVSLILAAGMIFGVVRLVGAFTASRTKSEGGNTAGSTVSGTAQTVKKFWRPVKTAQTADIGDAAKSACAVVINADTGTIVAEKNADRKAYPASTTKLMTLLIASEKITDYKDTFTMTADITDPLYRQQATVAGFSAGEAINMTDLLYGLILPSGGDAAIGIARKFAGSETAFAALMNRKAEALGLKNTHFVNPTGLYDSNQYTTASDLAVILKAVLENELCRKILSTYQYTTAATPQHPAGIPLTATLFKYMYGTEPNGATIQGGKTGYVNESGYCIATFGAADSGTNYLCVTLGAPSKWPGIYDQINLYTAYAK